VQFWQIGEFGGLTVGGIARVDLYFLFSVQNACDMLTAERLVIEGGVEASQMSEVLSSLKADTDRDVRYFVERMTTSLMSSASC